MSDIRFNQWLHQSGTGGVSQSDGGHVGIGTTNPLIPVGAGNTHILNVGVVTCNNIAAGSSITAGTFYGSGANLTSLPAQATIANNADNRVITGGSGVNLNGESNLTFDGTHLVVSPTSASNTIRTKIRASSANDDARLGIYFGNTEIAALFGQWSGSAFSTGLNIPYEPFTVTGSSGATRLRINNNGRVGIGTDSPLSVLTAYGENRGEGTVTGQITAKDNAAYNASPTAGIVFQGHYASNNAQAIFSGITGFKENANDGNLAGALAFHVRANGAVAYEALRIDSSGKLLINSSTVTASYGGKLQLTNSNFAMNSFANNQHAQTFMFAKSRGTSGSGGTIVQDNDFCGHIEWYADDGVDTANQIAKISGRIDGSPNTNVTPGELLFYTTAANANASTERLRIASDGDVTMNTSASANFFTGSALNIVSDKNVNTGLDDKANYHLVLANPNNDNNEAIGLAFGITDTGSKVGAAIVHHRDSAGSQGSMKFFTRPSNAGPPVERVRIRANGDFNVDSSNASITAQPAFYVHRSSGCGSYRPHSGFPIHHFYSNAGGTYSLESYVNGDGSYVNLSDYRLKENIVSISNGIDIVKQLNPVKFDWKSSSKTKNDLGFIAHEVQTLIPTAVDGTKDQMKEDGSPFYQGIAQTKIIPYLTAALKEAITEIETLKTKVAALEGS